MGIAADLIFLAILAGIALIGSFVGFGKGLKFMTGGVVGIIISVVLCYCFGGMVLDIPFVNTMMSDLAAKWANVAFLSKIHLEIIIFYIVFFIITMLVRILLVALLKNVLDSDAVAIKVVNKVLGAALFVLLAFILMFLIFQIITWIGGNTAASFESSLSGTFILMPLYHWNPMAGLIHLT